MFKTHNEFILSVNLFTHNPSGFSNTKSSYTTFYIYLAKPYKNLYTFKFFYTF